MKIVFWTLTVLFVLFAALQYNDPDPFQWMLLYGAVAVHFAMAAWRKISRPAVQITLAAAVVWMVILLPDFLVMVQFGGLSIGESMKAEKPWIELTREFLGLLIAALGCVFLLLKSR